MLITTTIQPKINHQNGHAQSESCRQQKVKSVLLIVNQPSGNGRTVAELERLQQDFNQTFASIPWRSFAITTRHDEVVRLTQSFLNLYPGSWFGVFRASVP